MFGGPEVSYHQIYSARDWLSILKTPYPTQNLQKKHRTDLHMMPRSRISLKYTTTDHKEGEKLEDQRNVGESSCNFGEGTDQRFQILMFMTMMMMMMMMIYQNIRKTLWR